MGKSILIVALGCLLIVQVTAATSDGVFGAREVPLGIGEVLPFEVEGWDAHQSAGNEANAACMVAFACTTTCPFCSRLATRMSNDRDVREGLVDPIGFILGGARGATEWAEDHGLDPSRVFTLSAKRSFLRRSVAGDIWFTPTRLVLTPGLVVRDARPSDELPGSGQLRDLCRAGGIAPRSVDELRAIHERGSM